MNFESGVEGVGIGDREGQRTIEGKKGENNDDLFTRGSHRLVVARSFETNDHNPPRDRLHDIKDCRDQDQADVSDGFPSSRCTPKLLR